MHVKINQAKSTENPGRWYAVCNKFPNDSKCAFFRWIDDVVLQPRFFSKLGIIEFFFIYLQII